VSLASFSSGGGAFSSLSTPKAASPIYEKLNVDRPKKSEEIVEKSESRRKEVRRAIETSGRNRPPLPNVSRLEIVNGAVVSAAFQRLLTRRLLFTLSGLFFDILVKGNRQAVAAQYWVYTLQHPGDKEFSRLPVSVQLTCPHLPRNITASPASRQS
jgi:hypothetical protein